jgi:hypothetical protein
MIPHDTTEKMPRIPSTIFEIVLEFAMISSSAAPEVDGKTILRKVDCAPLGQRAPVWEWPAVTGLGARLDSAELYHAGE